MILPGQNHLNAKVGMRKSENSGSMLDSGFWFLDAGGLDFCRWKRAGIGYMV